MECKHPDRQELTQLLRLWKEAFGDWNGFWEAFLETGFSPERCLCLLEQGQVTAALTWLDCSCRHEKMAYLYAVVTHPQHRGRGLCRTLLEKTHALLAEAGYAAALLVPAEEGLRRMYRKLGYADCTEITEFACEAAGEKIPLRAVGPEEFLRLRRQLLPAGSVWQEGENLAFLARQAQFYAGEDLLLTAYGDADSITAMELLGNRAAAPSILQTLGSQKGVFRCPGRGKPFAMQHPLTENAGKPAYFAFAFD